MFVIYHKVSILSDSKKISLKLKLRTIKR